MKKRIFQNNTCFSAVIAATFLLSAYTPIGDKVGQSHDTAVVQKKPTPDLDIIRKRIVGDLLEPAINEAEVKKLVSTIQPDGSWPGINYKDVSRTGFEHSRHLENMLTLARALKKPGSRFYGDPGVKNTVSSALNFWIDHDFICDNWWWNEMGTPNWMVNTLLVLDSDLTAKQRTEGARIASRASLEGFGARPGGDLIQLAGMLGKQGLFKRDDAIVDRVVKVMASEIKTTTGRGLQPDMSFHHRTDNVISTLTYGTGYAEAFAYWAVKTRGTRYTLPEASLNLLVDYYLDGISKSMAFRRYPDIGAKNRDLSRKGTLNPESAHLAENLLLVSNYRKKELERVVRNLKGEKVGVDSWSKFFWHSEYYTHQRPNYFTSVRMHSDRQNSMEEPHNEEGLKNHHFADGSNFVTRTGKEYLDIFPVWDWLKIPGATIVQSPSLPNWKEIAKKGKTDFVGGVTDGLYGAAAFDFSSPHDPIKARKSWFFFDREYVCLGAGISSEADYPVATTLNQCLLHKDVIARTNTGQTKLQKGKHDLSGVAWVFHDSVGYLFTKPTDVTLSNATAEGNWRQINHHPWATEETVRKDVFTLWLNHGQKPSAADYAYIVVPAVAATDMERYAKAPQVQVLSNTAALQAVHHKSLNKTGIVFYQAGTIKLDNNIILAAKNPCLVMVQMNGKEVKSLAVSDPTRKLSRVELQLNTPVEITGKTGHAAWDAKEGVSTISIDLPTEGFAGSTVLVDLEK